MNLQKNWKDKALSLGWTLEHHNEMDGWLWVSPDRRKEISEFELRQLLSPMSELCNKHKWTFYFNPWSGQIAGKVCKLCGELEIICVEIK